MAGRQVRLFVFVCSLIVLGTSPLFAQATTSKHLVWDQQASDLATANGYTYTYYADGATTGVALTAVTCTGTAAPFTCSVLFPAFTPGAHTVVLTATDIAGESPKSAPPFSFTFVIIPASPANLRIGD